MCTAINWNGYFGRTLDYEHGFGEEVVIMPRNFPLSFRHKGSLERHFAVIGMARVENGFPLFFDGANECGVAMAGLNFVGHAHFPTGEGIASFELIPYILAQVKSVREAVDLFKRIQVVDTPFSSSLSPSPLHWIIADKRESVTVESTEDGLEIYDNPVGVLANSPPFPFQTTYLKTFLNLTAEPAKNRFSRALDLAPFSRGMGAIGLPGDLSSTSRFVRASFMRENAVKEKSVSQFFHILSSVEQQKGAVILDNGELEYTRYTSCIDLEKCVYHYTTYYNRRITAVALTDLDGEKIRVFPLETIEDIKEAKS